MKVPLSRILALLLCLSLSLSAAALAESAVPERLPDDLGGKTLYGYLMELKTRYLPSGVFSDSTKYTDADRENARRAARLVIDAATAKMEEAGAPDQYNLYLRAWAFDLQYRDSRNASHKQKALADYAKTAELGGTYAQADYDRLLALELQAAPLAWQVPQILTPAEAGRTLGIPGDTLLLLKSPYQQADGSRLGAGYALVSVPDPADGAIFVLADPQGGKARYDRLKGFAFLGKAEQVPGLGDEAVLMGLRNIDNDPLLQTTMLVLKESLVLQVRVPDAVWRGPGYNMDPRELALRLAERFLVNLYDSARTVQPMDAFPWQDLKAVLSPDSGLPDSPVPDELPADLGGQTVYGYLTSLRGSYLKPNVFTGGDYSEADRNNARRALRLMIGVLSQGFDQNGLNPYELEIRGACYAAAFADTGDPRWRQLAVNDYRQALNMGYILAKPDYDRLAGPLLKGMADMKQGASGAAVLRLQEWLGQSAYLNAEPTGVFDEATRLALEAFEKEAGLAPDGIADLACLLALYARVDGGDAPLPGL